MEHLREMSQDMQIWLRKTYRAWQPEIGKFQRFWADAHALLGQHRRLLAVKHFAEVGECLKCGGAGLVAQDKPCPSCAGLGSVIASEVGPPIEDDSSVGDGSYRREDG
jgi:hypothetical protein